MSTVTVGIPDPSTCAINPDAGGGGGGLDIPIGSPVGTSVVQVQNPFAGAGTDMSVLQYPASPDEGVLVAVQLEGDAFPRLVWFADPQNGLWFNDGTVDPTVNGPFLSISNNAFLLGAPNGVKFQVLPNSPIDYQQIGGDSVNTSLLVGASHSTPESTVNPLLATNMIVNAFSGDDVALAIQLEGDAFPRWLLLSDATDGLYMGDGTFDPYAAGRASFEYDTSAPAGGLRFSANDGAAIKFNASTSIDLSSDSGEYSLSNLPTSDPGVSGQLWSNLGILTVSAG